MVKALSLPFTGKYFYGWVIVGIAFIANMLSSGTGGYGLGLYIGPMNAELGWSNTSITFGQTLKTWVNGLAGPFLGPRVDKLGARSIMLAGGLLGGASLIMLGFVTETWQYYVLYSGFGALGVAEFGGVVTNAVIAKWFVRRRGTAMAYATMGVSMGGTLLVPLTQLFITLWGWRMAWILTGILIWILLVPTAYFFMKNKPEDLGLHPDGDAGAPGTPGGRAASQEISWTFREAVRTRSMWLAVIAFNLGGMGLSAMLLHNPRIIASKGFSPEVAAGYASFFAFMALVSKPAWGYLMDRYPMRYVNMGVYLGSFLGLAFMFVAEQSPVMMIGYAVVFGFFIGATPMIAPMTWSNYYGRAFAGTIQGSLTPIQMVSSSLAPLWAAFIVDRTNSYDIAIWTYMGAYLIAATFMFFASKPQYPGRAVVEQAKAG
ncbi:MAG: MFS transporter [Chloroflexi bacterium]|nr:MFS transporter [Chloroflexota bacterium]